MSSVSALPVSSCGHIFLEADVKKLKRGLTVIGAQHQAIHAGSKNTIRRERRERNPHEFDFGVPVRAAQIGLGRLTTLI